MAGTGFGAKDRIPQQDVRTRRTLGNLSIKLDEPSGMTIAFNGIKVKPKTNTGLAIDANGLYVALSTTPGLEFSSGLLQVLVDPIGGVHKTVSGLDILVADAVEDNFASFDSGGLIQDSGYDSSDFMATGSGVTAVTGTAPIASSGGTTPDISLTFGTGLQNDTGTLKTKDSEIVHDSLSGVHQNVNTNASPSFYSTTLGTVSQVGRVKIFASGSSFTFDSNAGLCVTDADNAFGTWQSASSLDGFIPDANGDWAKWGLFFLNYFSTSDLFVNCGLGRIFVGGGTGWLGNPTTKDELFLGNNIVVADDTSLGSELITNGDFVADTDWTKGAGWRITGGVAEKYTGGIGSLSPIVPPSIAAGSVYLLTFDIPIMTVAKLTKVTIGGLTLHPAVGYTSSGSFSYIIRPTSTANLVFSCLGATTSRFTIDNVSLKQITGGSFQAVGGIVLNSANIATDTSIGMKIGTATNQKFAFWNATPIVQPSGDILTALNNLGLVASPSINLGASA